MTTERVDGIDTFLLDLILNMQVTLLEEQIREMAPQDRKRLGVLLLQVFEYPDMEPEVVRAAESVSMSLRCSA